MTINEQLAAVVEEHEERGSSRANLYKVRPPAGYEVMQKSSGLFYWVCYNGCAGYSCPDKWAAFGGAASDACAHRDQPLHQRQPHEQPEPCDGGGRDKP